MKDFTPTEAFQNVPTIHIDPQSDVAVIDQIIGQFPGLAGSVKKYEFAPRNVGRLDPFAVFEDVRN